MNRRLLSSVLASTLAFGALSLPSGASTSAYAQMKMVIADALAQSSVRVTASASVSGQRVVQVTDAGRIDGRQSLTLTNEGYSNTILAELIAGHLYVKGDASILVSYLGLSKSVANQLKSQWFGIPKSSSYYTEVAQGLTIATGMAEVTMTKSVTAAASTTLAGVSVNVLKGTSVKSALQPSYSESLYFSPGAKPLPVEVSQVVQGSLGTLKFSHWNERIALVAPKVKLQLT